jgi:hypothetical protein
MPVNAPFYVQLDIGVLKIRSGVCRV